MSQNCINLKPIIMAEEGVTINVKPGQTVTVTTTIKVEGDTPPDPITPDPPDPPDPPDKPDPGPGQPDPDVNITPVTAGKAQGNFYSHNTASPVVTYNGDIYWTYVDGNRKVRVAKNNEHSGPIGTVNTDVNHQAPSIGVENGYIHLTFGMHEDPWKYYRSTEPGGLIFVKMPDPTAHNKITYAGFTNDKNGKLYLWYKFSRPFKPGEKEGSVAANIATYDSNSKRWTSLGGQDKGVFWMSVGADPNPSKEVGPWYQPGMVHVVFDKDNVMHAVLGVNEGKCKSIESVLYATFDGSKWKDKNGTQVSLPIDDSRNNNFAFRDIQAGDPPSIEGKSAYFARVVVSKTDGVGITYRYKHNAFISWKNKGFPKVEKYQKNNKATAPYADSAPNGNYTLTYWNKFGLNGVIRDRTTGDSSEAPIDVGYLSNAANGGKLRYMVYLPGNKIGIETN